MEGLQAQRSTNGASRGKRSILMRLLGDLVPSSKRKRDEQRKRLDLSRAMRDSSVERLAAVISSARTEFGDRLNDLCTDAERVLQRLLSQQAEVPTTLTTMNGSSAMRRKVTLRERLLLADSEANSATTAAAASAEVADAAASLPIEIERDEADTTQSPPVLQAVLRLVRSTSPPTTTESGQVLEQNQAAPGPSLAQQLGLTTVASSSASTSSGGAGTTTGAQMSSASSRSLLSALLWEERNVDNGWVAFGVSMEPMFQRLDRASRSQSLGHEQLNRSNTAGSTTQHRPTASLDNVTVSEVSTQAVHVPQTPGRASLMSLLSQAEEAGSGIIFMNSRQLVQLSPPKDEQQQQQQGVEQTCCVCMGHQKGAAFIPCGHTFCRSCCRELRAARGTCPLCNKEISDILNIY